jgi:hypothetical protein
MNVTRTTLAATLLATGMIAVPAMAGPPVANLKDLLKPGHLNPTLKNPIKPMNPVFNPKFPLKPILPGGGGGGGNPPQPNPPQQPNKPDWTDIVGSVLGGGHGHHYPQQPWYPDPGYAPGYPSYPGHTNHVPSNSVPSVAQYRLLVMNPASNDGDVMFVVRGHEYRLAAGTQQELKVRRKDLIRFDRGNGSGIARYSIQPGTYIFRVTEDGWDVYRKTIRVTIDNRENEQYFRYLVGRQSKRLPSGEITTHMSRYPIRIMFDPGNGDSPVRRQLIDGTFRVGLNLEEDGVTLQRVEPIDQLALAD